MASTYYPETTDGRAEWWDNIIENSAAAFTAVGFAAAKVTGILNDAAWAVYVYRTIRQSYEVYHPSVIAYANTIASGIGGTSGQGLPPPPEPPAWPTAPVATITCDFERRREGWVTEAKASPTYTQSIGETLRIIAPTTPFNPATYKTELLGLFCSGPKTVSGKFRKAGRNADGIDLRGRKVGTSTWTKLGRFTATPFNAQVPVANSDPETWEFQARVFRRDVEFGLESDILEVIVKG